MKTEKVAVKEKEFNSYDYPNLYFPNWFEKWHFEEMLGRKLTDEQFQEIKNYLDEFVPDIISETICEILNENETVKEILNEIWIIN